MRKWNYAPEEEIDYSPATQSLAINPNHDPNRQREILRRKAKIAKKKKS